VDRLPVPVSLGQIAPRHARPIPIDHGIHEQAVVGCGAADMAFATGQEVFDPDPLIVAKCVAVHPSASRLPTVHESENK
jgi:hypothetical protein